MKITQKDIAAKLGVSTSLVSRVLSGQAHKIGVHPSKIEEILRVAKEMNYVPSPAALALRGKKSNTIGIVAYDFNSPFFSQLISELQELSHINNYSLLLVGFLNRTPNTANLLPLGKHFVDGIIILGSFGDLSWTDAFGEIPIARIGHGEHGNLNFSVSIDERDAMSKIFRYVVKDLKETDAVFAMRDIPAHVLRRDAALAAAEKFGCSLKVMTAPTADKEFLCGSNIAKKILSEKKPLPRIIVCATDTIAMGITKKFSENDVHVPRDVAIIGFDDIPEASNYIPSITSFRQPVKEYARLAFDAVINNYNAPQKTKLLEGDLLIRRSTLP